MDKLFKREIKSSYKSFLIWTISTFLVTYMSFWEYATIGNSTDYDAMFSTIPKTGQLMFGLTDLGMGDIIGYYGLIFYYIVFIGVAYAFILGNNIMQKELDDKTSEFLFTKPITRRNILIGKMLSSWVIIVLYCLINAIGTVVMMTNLGDDVYTNSEITMIVSLTYIGLCILMFMIYQITLALNITFNKKIASAASGLIIMYMYAMSLAVQVFEPIKDMNILTPWRYFAIDVIVHNDNMIKISYIIVSILIIGVFKLLAFRKIEDKSF